MSLIGRTAGEKLYNASEAPVFVDAQYSAHPNFFLAGAPKAGTTALYRYLDQHPAIYMSPIKEPHFFADEVRIENFAEDFHRTAEPRLPALRAYLDGPVREKFSGGPVADWVDYVKLFQCVEHQTAIGEASVCYLWSPSAPRNIHARIPQAKIIVMLRNPIERAFSQYRHMLSFANRRITFDEHIDAALRSPDKRMSELFPFLHFGLYAEQLERYLSSFGPAQVQIHFYEDFCREPLRVMQAIFRFVGVDAGFAPDLSTRHMEAKVPRSFWLKKVLKSAGIWKVARGLAPRGLREPLRRITFQPGSAVTMTSADQSRLADYYRDDVRKLSAILQRDLTGWLAAKP